jgi:hypothetical protein
LTASKGGRLTDKWSLRQLEQQRTGTNALRPVTIAQVINATQSFAESEFYIDGAEVKDVSWEAGGIVARHQSLHAASWTDGRVLASVPYLTLLLLFPRSLSWRASGTSPVLRRKSRC